MGCLQALEIMGRFELVRTTEFELEPGWWRPTGLPPLPECCPKRNFSQNDLFPGEVLDY